MRSYICVLDSEMKKITFPFRSSDVANNDCDFQIPSKNRRISTPRLKRLLALHLEPINVVISYGPQTNSDLGVSFPLRCFQRLSIPDIATQRVPLARQLVDQRSVHSGPLVLGANPLKIQRLQKIGDQPVSRTHVLHHTLVPTCMNLSYERDRTIASSYF